MRTMKRLLSLIVLLLLTSSPLAAQVVNASRINLNGTWVSVGSVSPESSVTGSPGDLYIRTNGSLYIKATGSNTNTGWSLMAAGISSGTVTSVGLSLPGTFAVSGSPVTTSGTLTASLTAQSAKTFLAGPASGSATTPTWRQPQLTDLGQGGATVTQVVAWDGTQWAAADNSGTGAPIGAQYLTLATDATLTNERVLTAGTGVTVTDAGAGSTLTVATDGPNITGVPISTGISGLGTGVATFLATPSSANLATAVTGETGSGALVFGTSPTLTTPALGTPTALTLTSATGLPLTGLVAASDDQTIVSSGSAFVAKTLPSCTDTGGNHLNYDQSTNTFSCGTSGTGGGSGTVTHTGALTSGQLIKGNGTDDITVGNLSGDVTTSGSMATTIANSAVTLAKIANASANSKLLGSGASGSGSAYAELTLGTNLSMSGTTLNATVGGGTVYWQSPSSLRLSLTTNTYLTTTDVTGATTVYWTPVVSGGHGTVICYNGSNLEQQSVTQKSIALGTLTSGKNYNVYWDCDGAALSLGAAWTNDTTPSETIDDENGAQVLSSDHTKLYLGVFRTTSTTATEDSVAKRFLWNAYNQVPRLMKVLETTDTWSYNTATFRQARATATNQLDYVSGDAATYVTVDVHINVGSSFSVDIAVGVGLDSTSVNSALQFGNTAATGGIGVATHATYKGYPGLGRHTLVWLEKGDPGGTQTWYGDNGGAYSNGIWGQILN